MAYIRAEQKKYMEIHPGTSYTEAVKMLSELWNGLND
jgi:hypothetical protein